MPEAATVTIPGVEIVRVGKWAASTGPVEVTAEDIADAVAAEKDPEVDKGPLRFGHTGALSNLGDSTPAFGWLANLSLADVDGIDGQRVLGDLVDVPKALAPAIKAAFKRRSAELAWGVETPGGKNYRMVIDGLALLGVQPPAVKGMADLAALYDPDAAPVTLATSKLTAESHSTLSFYDGTEPTKAERIADRLTWAKEAAGQLAALVGIAGLQGAWDALDQMVPADSRGLSGPAPHAVPVRTTPDGGTMPKYKPETLKKVRTKLSLGDDVDDDKVAEEAEDLGIAPDGETPAPEDKPADKPADEKVPAALSAATIEELRKSGLTVVATSAFDEVQRQAAAGAEAHSNLAAQAREDVLDAAQRAGKLGGGEPAKALRSNLAASLEKDFAGTKAVIDALPALVPVGEIGNSSNGPERTDLAAGDDAAWDAWESQVFGTEIARPAKEA